MVRVYKSGWILDWQTCREDKLLQLFTKCKVERCFRVTFLDEENKKWKIPKGKKYSEVLMKEHPTAGINFPLEDQIHQYQIPRF